MPNSGDTGTVNVTQLPTALQLETSFEQEAAAETYDIPCENSELDLFEKQPMRMVAKSESLGSPSLRRK